MTVVDTYICGKKFDPSENQSVLPPKVASLLIEGIAQNTTGSVFMSEVINKAYLLPIFKYNLNNACALSFDSRICYASFFNHNYL